MEQNLVDNTLQTLLLAAAGQCRCPQLGGIICQLLQRRLTAADLGTDTAAIAGITVRHKLIYTAILDDLRRLNQTQCKGVHAQNIALEHILHRIAGTAGLGIKVQTAGQAAALDDLVHRHGHLVHVEGELIGIPAQQIVTLIDYGAAVQALTVPDRQGKPMDVVLGYDSAAEYETNGGFLGATIGRMGNRIGGASFTLNGKVYPLAKNDGENHLHGGFCGFDRRMWQGEACGEDTVCFHRLSPDGEEGYPGNLQVQVAFTLADHTLTIRYDADTDADTVVSLTNHSYFNLNGGGTVLDHYLQLSAERFTENDSACLPTGKLLPVAGSAFDFRTPKTIGLDIDCGEEQLIRGGGYDHNFVLTGASPAAVLWSEASGIRMTMHTDLPGVQFYSGNSLLARQGKDGAHYDVRFAACLETQLFPNALRCYGFPSPILRAGQHLHTETAYAFDVLPENGGTSRA